MKNWKKGIKAILTILVLTGLLQLLAIEVHAVEPAEEASEYKSYDEAIVDFRQLLVNREEHISVQFKHDTDLGYSYTSKFFTDVIAHTGKPKEGDYLKHNLDDWYYVNQSSECKEGVYYYSFDVELNWYTTAEQEKEVDEAVAAVLAQLNLWDKDDYQKIRGAYEYITQNVDYDHDRVNDASYRLKQSTYAAVVQKKAVCEGFASLFYRLMLELGIDARVITGYAGENHAWNIVRLEGSYYNMDPTWDENLSVYYRYFLCTPYDFAGHTRDSEFETQEFHAAYPMAQMPYVRNVEASGILVNGMTWVLDGDTGVLTISGIGNMPDFQNIGAPWYPYHENIKGIVLTEGITSVGKYSFVRCKYATFVSIPSTVEKIGAYGFNNCRALAEIKLPEDLTAIDSNAFSECVALKEIVIPGSVAAFGSGVFSNCPNLTKVTFEEGITAIPSSMFYNADNLQSVTFPGTVTEIGDTAFRDCDKLKEVTIPAQVTAIGYAAFSDCTGLKNIFVEDGNKVYTDIDGVLFSKDKKTLVTFPAGRSGTYTIPGGVTAIGDASFCRAKYMTDVIVPDSVTAIGRYAFTWCDRLTKVTVGKNIKSLGDYAYGRCSNLETVVFLNPDTTIGKYCFSNCMNLTSITLPSRLKEMNFGLLTGCDKLANVVIPDTVTVIGDSVFCCSDGIKTILLPKEVSYIESCAFDRCKNLKEITIQGSIKGLEREAFSECTNLRFVRFGGTLSGVDTTAFQDCSNLTTVFFDSKSAANYAVFLSSMGGLFANAKSVALPVAAAPGNYVKNNFTNTYTITYDGIDYILYSNHSCSFKQSSVTEDDHAKIITYQCTNCAAKKQVVTLMHRYSTQVTEPTCTDRGYTTYTCSCGVSYVDSYVDSLGHDWDEGVVTKEATETETGIRMYTCNRCLETKTSTIPILEHVHRYEAIVTIATCTEQGYTTHTCRCGENYIDSYVAAIGHTWNEGVITKEPTTATEGIIIYTCLKCEAIREESIPALEDEESIINNNVYRIYGRSRYDTSFKIADTLKESYGVDRFDMVIVASGTNFADALAGSYLAYKKQAPIIMTNGVNAADVRNYVENNLNVGGTVYLLGGTIAVPEKVEKELSGYIVKRLWGRSRYDTNLEILKEAGVSNEDILVCTGTGFADSLSVSALGKAILLVGKQLSDVQKEFLESLDGNDFYIIGGTIAVSETVESELKAYGTPKRIGGRSRFETSILVAEEFFDTPDSAVLAYAQNYPDGLSGGPLAYSVGAPLILTQTGQEATVANYANSKGIKGGFVLGGTGLISDETARRIFGKSADESIIVK